MLQDVHFKHYLSERGGRQREGKWRREEKRGKEGGREGEEERKRERIPFSGSLPNKI